MHSEAFGEDSQKAEDASSLSEAASKNGEDEDEFFTPAEVYAQEYKGRPKTGSRSSRRRHAFCARSWGTGVVNALKGRTHAARVTAANDPP